MPTKSSLLQVHSLTLSCYSTGFRKSPAISRFSLEEQIGNLEEFWDSEAPRIGEPGSTGWADWYGAGKPVPVPPKSGLSSKRSTSGAVSTSSLDPYQCWAQEEMLQDELLNPPSRSTDPDVELDPYAMILFSDIRPFLFAITSDRSKGLFRLMWLSYLGLHVPGLEITIGASYDDRWAPLHLVSSPYLEAIFPSSTDGQGSAPESHAGVLVGREKQYLDCYGPIKNWSYRCIGPLEASEYRNGNVPWALWTKEDVAAVDVKLVRRVFEQCRMSDDDVEWDVLTLAFEAAIDVKRQVHSFAYLAPLIMCAQCIEEVAPVPCISPRVSISLGRSCTTGAPKRAPRRSTQGLSDCSLLASIY